MQLRFLGGAGTVTGSKYPVEHEGRRLLVDCGLFQGLKQLRLRNWSPLPVPARSIDAVVLTHAHIDHSGFIPRLMDLGFRGKVFATRATVELCRLLLPDAGHLQEEEARYATRHGFSKHSPALPLYTEESARRALENFQVRNVGESFEPTPGFEARFHRAGHILGAASVHLQAGGHSILFSGDLGRSDDLVIKPPEPPEGADVVLIESTYGNRSNTSDDTLAKLADVVCRTASRGGVIVGPLRGGAPANGGGRSLSRRRIPGRRHSRLGARRRSIPSQDPRPLDPSARRSRKPRRPVGTRRSRGPAPLDLGTAPPAATRLCHPWGTGSSGFVAASDRGTAWMALFCTRAPGDREPLKSPAQRAATRNHQLLRRKADRAQHPDSGRRLGQFDARGGSCLPANRFSSAHRSCISSTCR